jgi:WD40 repeat protein
MIAVLLLLAGASAPPADPPEVAALIVKLASDDIDARQDAARRLEALGEAALPALTRAARRPSKDPDLRLRAAVIAAAIRHKLYGEVRRFTGHAGWVFRAAVSPDGKHVVSLGDALRVWDLKTGKQLRRLPGAAWGWGLSFSRDGKRLLASGNDRVVRLYDFESGKELKRLEGHRNEVWVASFSPDGKYAITGGYDTTLRVWDLDSGKEVRQFESTGDLPRCLAWSPDGKRVAVGHFSNLASFTTSPGTVRVWDVATGKPLLAGKGHTGAITAVDWSRDGKRIATSSFDRTVRVWDAATCKPLLRLDVSPQGSDGVAFLRDGKRVAVTGWGTDHDVSIWDLETARRTSRHDGHAGGALGVCVVDGRHFLSHSTDGTLRLWPVPPR